LAASDVAVLTGAVADRNRRMAIKSNTIKMVLNSAISDRTMRG
jgi:hypothetical protein